MYYGINLDVSESTYEKDRFELLGDDASISASGKSGEVAIFLWTSITVSQFGVVVTFFNILALLFGSQMSGV